jgi:GAF domain-containing protein
MHTLEKTNDYALMLEQIKALIADEGDTLANMANIASFVYHSVGDLNWVGFYLLKESDLVLGPFNGLPACTRIKMGKGVCGTSAQTRMVLNVSDVHLFEGHIACDSASNSELVVPVLINNQIYGVFDVDSPLHNRFDPELEAFLIEVVKCFVIKKMD